MASLWVMITNRGIPLEQLIAENKINPPQLTQYAFHLVFGLILYLISLYLFNLMNAQFLLPVYSTLERLNIFRNFNSFSRGLHGPLIFVRDGEVISHLGESEKAGPGVILVNSSSAVVVGNEVYGPGIVFTDKRKIGTVMDLRKQLSTKHDVRAVTRDGIEVGTDISIQFSISAPPELIYVSLDSPGTVKENLRLLEFGERGDVIVNTSEGDFVPDESNEIFRTIQQLRAGGTEGIPFVDLELYGANLFVKDRVQSSFTNQPRRPDTGEKIDWSDLPVNVAVEEFRNTIVRYPFDDLFIPPGMNEKQAVNSAMDSEISEMTGSTQIASLDYHLQRRFFPLETIRREYSSRVRNSGFVAFVFVEKAEDADLAVGDRLSDQQIHAYPPVLLQYPRPLRQGMITVTNVSFGEIVPTNTEVRNQTVQNLIARWNSEAYRTEVGFEEQASLIRSRAKAQVQQDTVYALRDILQNSDKTKAALILRIFQALEAATVDSNNMEMVSMMHMLGDLREWFRFADPRDFGTGLVDDLDGEEGE